MCCFEANKLEPWKLFHSLQYCFIQSPNLIDPVCIYLFPGPPDVPKKCHLVNQTSSSLHVSCTPGQKIRLGFIFKAATKAYYLQKNHIIHSLMHTTDEAG